MARIPRQLHHHLRRCLETLVRWTPEDDNAKSTSVVAAAAAAAESKIEYKNLEGNWMVTGGCVQDRKF